jgi:hypothetical protein
MHIPVRAEGQEQYVHDGIVGGRRENARVEGLEVGGWLTSPHLQPQFSTMHRSIAIPIAAIVSGITVWLAAARVLGSPVTFAYALATFDRLPVSSAHQLAPRNVFPETLADADAHFTVLPVAGSNTHALASADTVAAEINLDDVSILVNRLDPNALATRFKDRLVPYAIADVLVDGFNPHTVFHGAVDRLDPDALNPLFVPREAVAAEIDVYPDIDVAFAVVIPTPAGEARRRQKRNGRRGTQQKATDA